MIDNTKWSEIYKKHSKKMLWVCKRYVNDLSLAEDLMHEGFITAMQKQNTFSGFGSFEGWLRTIMVNTSLIYLRKNKDRFFVSEIDIPDTMITTDINSATDIKSKIVNTDFTQHELLEVVEAIPEHHKIVFNMYVIDNFSHNEISKTLNITTNTSKSHLLRARKKIQELLFLKANEKEQKKERKKLFFWFLSMSGYIDSLYTNGFSSFKENPYKSFDIEGFISENGMQDKITSGYIFSMTLQKLITAIAAILIIVFLLLSNYSHNGKVMEENKAATDKSTVFDKEPGNKNTQVNAFQKDNSVIQKEGKPTVNKSRNTLGKTKTGLNSDIVKGNPGTSESSAATNKNKKHRYKKNKDEPQVVIKKIIDTIYVYK